MYLPARLQTVGRATRSLEFCETRPQTLPSCIAPSSPPDSSHRTSGMLLHHCGPNHKLNLLAYTSFNLLAACSWHACDTCMFEIMLWRLPLAMSLASSVSIIACQSQQSTLTPSFDYAPPAGYLLCCAVLCCAVLCCAVLHSKSACSTSSSLTQLAVQAEGPESEAWAAFEASRRAQDRAARRASATTAAPASNIQPVMPGSPPAHRHSG